MGCLVANCHLNFLQVKFSKQTFHHCHCSDTGITFLYSKPLFLCLWAHMKYSFFCLDYRNGRTASDPKSHLVQYPVFHSSQQHKVKGRVKKTELLNYFAHTIINQLHLKFLSLGLLYCIQKLWVALDLFCLNTSIYLLFYIHRIQ